MVEKRIIKNHDDDDDEGMILSNFLSNKKTDTNKIYFYEEINPLTALMINKQINDKSNELMALSIKYDLEKPIPLYIHLNSPGGDLMSSLGIMDNIVTCKVPVISRIEGVCASAATFMHIASHRRQMRKHSHIMIHELSSGHHGKYSESETHLQNLQNFMSIMKKLYKERTKLPDKMLNELLKKDLFLDSKLSLKFGLVDEII